MNVLDCQYQNHKLDPLIVINMSLKLLALTVLLITLTTSYEMDGDVIVLTDKDDFPSFLKEFPFVLVQFYAPWCGHQTATALKQANSPIKLAKVDSTKETQITKVHGIRGFPTLFYYVNGVKIPFTGNRNKVGIIDWCTKKLTPPVTNLDVESYNKLKENKKGVSAVLFSNDEAVRKQFNALALVDDYNKYYYAPEELVEREGEVLLLRDFDTETTFTGKLDNFAKWLAFEGRPRLLPYDQRTLNSVWGDENKRSLLFVHNNQDNTKAIHDVVQELANEGNGDILFGEMKTTDEKSSIVENFIKVKFDRPRIIIFDNAKGLKFVLTGELNRDTIRQFLTDFKADNAKKYSSGMKDQFTDPKEEEQPTDELNEL